jgi:hypothetical protein
MALYLHFWGQKGQLKSIPMLFGHTFLQPKGAIQSLVWEIVKRFIQSY